MYIFSKHQEEQVRVIEMIEEQVKNNALSFSTIAPVEDFENDPRLCLTGIHLPHQELLQKVQTTIIDPLRKISPEHYYYDTTSLHMTIKSVRVIHDPPNFSEKDIEKARKVFAEVIARHKKFNVYFYRLLLFPNNLALIGTTDEELDEIFLDLDTALGNASIPDEKIYISNKYIFSNMTLMRFIKLLSKEFLQTVQAISDAISFNPYTVDIVSLVTCNAVFRKLKIIDSWNLQ